MLALFAQYRTLASKKCSAEQTQLLGELGRRTNQLAFLLDNIAFLEQRAAENVFNNLRLTISRTESASAFFEQSLRELDTMRLFAESFYWISHKIISVVNAKQRNYVGKRLPGFEQTLRCAGVTNVRNNLMEHPFTANETFGLGGFKTGPTFGPGSDANGNEVIDAGLFPNALEFAQRFNMVLTEAIQKLEDE
jgi:hypothetical protein